MKKKMQKEEVSTKKTKAKDVRIDSAKKINTKSKIKNAEEISKKKANVKPKVEKIEQQNNRHTVFSYNRSILHILWNRSYTYNSMFATI